MLSRPDEEPDALGRRSFWAEFAEFDGICAEIGNVFAKNGNERSFRLRRGFHAIFLEWERMPPPWLGCVSKAAIAMAAASGLFSFRLIHKLIRSTNIMKNPLIGNAGRNPFAVSSSCVFAMLFSALGLTSHAATVNYSSGQNFALDGSNASILSNDGLLLGAVNFSSGPRTGEFNSGNPDPNVTVNGIAFSAVNGNIGTGVTGSLSSGITYSINSAGIDVNRPSGIDYSTAASLYGLAYDVIRTGSNATPMTFTLDNLTVGTEYSVQFIFSANDGTGTSTYPRPIYLTEELAIANDRSTAILQYGTSLYDVDGNLTEQSIGAGLLTATFTADSEEQLFTFYNNNSGFQRVSLAGFTLAVVPEPSSMALVLLGACSVLGIRRRA